MIVICHRRIGYLSLAPAFARFLRRCALRRATQPFKTQLVQLLLQSF